MNDNKTVEINDNAEFYERLIKEMLHDTTIYDETDHNKDRKTISVIKQLISNTESDLTDKEQDYLTKFECKTSTFYGLPKIHKSVTLNHQSYPGIKHRICEYRRGRRP